MPHSSQPEPDEDDVLRETWRGEKLADGEQIRNARNCKRNEEGWCAPAAELARADCQRHQQDNPENVEPAGWREPHSSPSRSCSTTCLHCINQAAVLGALGGESRSSSSSLTKSAANSQAAK